ncbi:MAG: M1 family aminopeptidase [Planctomycetota bacterium]|nr:M1 family aminopeptidase [Planctomycetota bacterium]
MGHGEWSGLGCGRRREGHALRGREPFAFPGTVRRYAPDREVDILHVRLEIALDPEVVAIEGVVTHEFEALADGTATMRLHAGELAIDRITDEEGHALAFRHVGEDLSIDLPRALDHGEPGAVRVHYRGTPRRGIYFIRPDAGYPAKPYQVWTQGQDEDSRYWFPCFDHPGEKFSSEILARVPAKHTVVSNGALVARTEHDDGTATWHWSQEGEHSAYLVTLCVGEFDEVQLGAEPVPLTAYVPVGMKRIAERAFARTPEMVRHFAERFGIDYPWEKYAQVVVEDFIFGGMENTSATTLIDIVLYDDRAALDFDLDRLVAHELAHQWWGDLVTCREWPHAWLNEGFATWSQAIWREHAQGVDEEAYERLSWLATYGAEDGGSYRRAIVDRRFEEPIDLFDHHLYEKGALVLHMLRKELGETGFWRSIQQYAEANRGRSVVTEDLRVAIEAATGRNLDWFLDQWVYHAGHPELTTSWSYDAAGKRLHVTLKQGQATGADIVDCFRLRMPVRVTTKLSTVIERTFEATRRDHTFTLDLDSEPASVELDPAGDLLATWKLEQPAAASRATLASDAPLHARVRAAKALTDEPTAENIAALAALLPTAFWGLAVEVAAALGAMRSPGARNALLAALGTVDHPKARRGVVDALGQFRHDETVGSALTAVLDAGDPSMFVEASAAAALGQVRTSGARAALERALVSKDAWAEVIRIGCVQGLAALGEPDVVPALTAATTYGGHVRLRTAAARALGTVGKRMAVHDGILDTLADLSTEVDLRLVNAAIEAMLTIGDPAALRALEGAPARHPDGRVRREAKSAALRLRKGAGATADAARLADDLEALRKKHAQLMERVEKLEG